MSSSLRRDDVTLLKTALAVLVVQKRLQKCASQTNDDTVELAAGETPLTATNISSAVDPETHRTFLPLIQHQEEEVALGIPDPSCFWKTHLQHVLQLIWKQQPTGSPQAYSLGVHWASQLEQWIARAAACASAVPTESDLTSWLAQQMAQSPLGEDTAWWNLWSLLVSLQPVRLSEYFVHALLDLLLLTQPSSAGPPKILYLQLLEHIVVDLAPAPVRLWTRRILQNGTPATCASWYSLSALADEYAAAGQGNVATMGESWLLLHGLAVLSERLAVLEDPSEMLLENDIQEDSEI